MSAKKTNKNASRTRVVLWVIVAVLVLILAAALIILWALEYTARTEVPAETTPSAAATVPTETIAEPSVVFEEVEDTTVDLGEGLQIINIGSYTGVYVEDGTDEVVSGVLMLVVTNNGENAVQYAQITLPTDSGEAQFSLSTLPAGESCVLLELNRMAYTGQEDITQATASNVATFAEPLSLCEEQLSLQILDGAINVTNISGQDITGDVVIYYKNAAKDLYYGGITYRVRIEGGMKAGEIKQIMASHFSDTGSKIMFVTAG